MKLNNNVVELHTRMLNDYVRTSSFLEAIAAVVRPGDVVVDVGTGTGVLAIAAARAGARHVYAIESGAVRKLAESIVAANGLTDRITVLAGRSTEIELPEQADVLLSEVIGNEPLAEKVLETMADAARRFLKPDARFVPRGIRICGVPVYIPTDERSRFIFTQDTMRDWQTRYGIDFSPLREVNRDALTVFFLDHQALPRRQDLCPPVLLAEIDFESFKGEDIKQTSVARVEAAGELSGLVVYFELSLSPRISLSTDPAQADKNNHWRNPVYLFVDPLTVQRGQRLEITYTYSMADHREWLDVMLLD